VNLKVSLKIIGTKAIEKAASVGGFSDSD